MSGTQDSLTVALTGGLPFIALVSAALALPLSLLLLWLYRRAVLRSMRHRSGAAAPSVPSVQASAPPLGSIELSCDEASASPSLAPHAESLFQRAVGGSWRAAVVHCIAGAGYAVVMTLGWLISDRSAIHPVKFLWLFWTYAWPVALIVNLVAGSTRRRKTYVVLAYFAVLGILAAIELATSPKVTVRDLFIVYWVWTAGLPTVLVAAFLIRRIRAVGPLVITFMVMAVTGSLIVSTLAGRDPRLVGFIVRVGVRLGLSGSGIFYSLHLIGFVVFGFVGWLLLQGVRRGYERKQISDQSLTCDSILLLFGIFQSIELVFNGVWWIFTGLAAFFVYKLVAKVGFWRLRRGVPAQAPKLLLLRVFSLGKHSEQLFTALGKHWLRAGSVRMIAGPDLARSTIEPHEFLEFLAGKLARRSIDGSKTLDLRLREMDTQPDWDGRFRVTDFFCHDDTWKMVLTKLIGESDAVLMDLRGFAERNAGCCYEIEELLNVAPLQRVVFVVDRTTDVSFLKETAAAGWTRLRTDSPNRELESIQLMLFRFNGAQSAELARLLRLVCAAAAATPAM